MQGDILNSVKQKGLAPLVIIILIALALGGYLLYQKQFKPAVIPQSSPIPTTNVPQPISNSVNQICSENKTYRSLEDALKEPNYVCYLDLSKKGLTELPPEVLQFPKLKSLYLNFNKIVTLPDEIVKLQDLTSIDLTGNPISFEEIQRLRKLLPKASIGKIEPMNPPFRK